MKHHKVKILTQTGIVEINVTETPTTDWVKLTAELNKKYGDFITLSSKEVKREGVTNV